MYKDKEKQKEAVRKAVQRHRGVIPEACNTQDVIPYPEYSMTDYRFYLTPPNTDRIPIDYVNKFQELGVDVQRGIVSVLVDRERKGLFNDVEERVDRAVAYGEWLANRKLPEIPILESVK